MEHTCKDTLNGLAVELMYEAKGDEIELTSIRIAGADFDDSDLSDVVIAGFEAKCAADWWSQDEQQDALLRDFFNELVLDNRSRM